jgi:hypothetical protein
MKFSLKALLGSMLVAAIAFAVVRSVIWRLTAKRDIESRIRLGDLSQGYPVINAVGFFDGGIKVVALHRVTSAKYDDGNIHRPGAHIPPWLDTRSFGPNRIFDCLVDGNRVYIEDDAVLIFYATDGENPKYARLKYRDYAAIDNVGFLKSNEDMWRLAEQHSKEAELSVVLEPPNGTY